MDTSQPLQAQKPTLLDLWMSYHFDIPTLATDASVETGTVQAMMNSLPVQRDDAERVLAQLSARYPTKDFSLETVHVVLKKPVNMSEVARIMQQIDAEFESARQGIQGLAQGTAQHAIRTARTEIEARYFAKLRQRLGDDLAMQIVFERETQTNVT